jgi:CubicO group peptidase (beta-lactamase class C family)
MKVLKSLFLVLLSIVLIGSLYAVASGRTYLFKAVWYNFAGIDDYQVFTNNTVTAAIPQPWPLSSINNEKDLPAPLLSMLEELNTIGLLAIKNDSIIYERYWDGYDQKSYSGSFSVTKSITSLLIGIALKEGKIKSLEEPIGNYLPEFKSGEKSKVRIVDLLTMSSGSDWDESYANPLSVTTEMYYGTDVYKVATGVNIIHKPGTFHSYKSGDTQLLGLLLEKATGMSLSQYASQKLWQPLGAEHPALWSTDKTGGHEKAYCCFNSNTRDFARIGRLMLDSGRWKGQEIITKDYFVKSVSPCMIPDELGEKCNYYGYQWWIFPADEPIFYARGILGQYIIVIPSKKVVLVRLGKRRSEQRINGAPAEVDALIKWGKSL